MKSFAQSALRAGCLLTVLALLLGLVMYPRGKWLFAFFLLGITSWVLVLNRTAKELTPRQLADSAEKLLNGTTGTWDVDDYEHLNPRDPKLREAWHRTMEVGGLPETWVALEEDKKQMLRNIIRDLRGEIDTRQ